MSKHPINQNEPGEHGDPARPDDEPTIDDWRPLTPAEQLDADLREETEVKPFKTAHSMAVAGVIASAVGFVIPVVAAVGFGLGVAALVQARKLSGQGRDTSPLRKLGWLALGLSVVALIVRLVIVSIGNH